MKSSYSKISSFAFCAKKYEHRYVLKTPAPQKPELVFGVSLHKALEENFKQKVDTRRDLELKDVAEIFHRELEEGLLAVPDEFLRGAADTHYLRGMGENFLEIFMAQRAPDIQPAPRGVECGFHLPLPGGHEITGKFDLLDTDWVLHDFKTSNKPYDTRKADPAQLVIYAWACERMFGRLPKALVFDVFVKGDGADGDVRLQEPVVFPVPGPREMALVARRLQSQIEKISETQAAGHFPRAFIPLRCRWCEFQEPCVQEWVEAGRPAPLRIALEDLV